jgi:hypothetical protein
VARDVGAHVLPRGEGGHVVVVFHHIYYNRKFRAAIVRRRKTLRGVGAWSSSSWMRLGTGGPGGGGEMELLGLLELMVVFTDGGGGPGGSVTWH